MSAITDTRSLVTRCPACGQPVDSAAARCSLCDFSFGDDRVTGADVTPYAKAYAQGDAGWWTMCRWVWFAGSERLQHIALMRPSAAARRFAWMNAFLLALGIAGFQATRVGWRTVGSSPVVEPSGSLKPLGRGWLHAAAAPRPLPPGQAPQIPVDLWWNPAQTMIASVLFGLTALLLVWLVLLCVRTGITLAHTEALRGDQRMSAALLYGTAWWIPALAGIVVCLLRPVALAGQINSWPWYPTTRGISLIAGAIAGLAAILWWFWLIRLAATAPARTRSRVMAFCIFGIPLLLGGVSLAWWVGLEIFQEFLVVRLNIHF